MIKKIFDRLFLVCLILIAAALLIVPVCAVQGAELGLKNCARAIIPSLFPFFVVTNLLTSLGYTQQLGSSCLLLGLIGGYPVGAQTVVNQYQCGTISKQEAQRLLLYCNNSGPAFIFGVVGHGVFQSFRTGLALYLIHVASAILMALAVKIKRTDKRLNKLADISRTSFPKAVTASIRQAGISTIQICIFVIFFSILCTYFQYFLSQKWVNPIIIKLLLGSLELAGGVTMLSTINNQIVRFCLISFLLGFGGLCVTFQTYSILEETDLSAKYYLPAKILQGTLSVLLAVPISRFLNLSGSIKIRQLSPLFLLVPFVALFILVFLKESTGKTSSLGL